MFLIIAIAVWVCALVLWWLFSNAFRHSDMDRLKSRLLGSNKTKKTKAAGPSASLIQTDETSNALLSTKFLKRFQLQAKLQELLEQAGMKWSTGRLVNTCLLCFVATAGVAWVMLPGHLRRFAYVPALVVGSFPVLGVLRKRTARMSRFEELFPESLEFVARSMRAGHAFSVSLEMIHREFQEPLAGEFRRTFEEHNLGLPLDVALQKLAKRIPSLDVHFFVSAVLLQKRTGGNLAEILDKLAYVIRERFKLRGRIRAISAHGKMTGGALTCIPIGVAVIMFYANPDYVRFFFLDDVGNIMLGSAVLLQLIGYGIIRQIVKIEV
ncbi:MAG TPA: type II secretion system F family protein [Bryobacteraceae bacterium]|jgi:tight adherence protein B|nr:type II secretion system F family protein [Bryobacteraceae bacterium]